MGVCTSGDISRQEACAAEFRQYIQCVGSLRY